MNNETFTRKVLPFLKIKYFESNEHQVIFEEIEKFVDKYSELPTKEAITIQLEKRTDLNEEAWKTTQNLVNGLTHEQTDEKWLVDTTEQYCKDRALHLAVLDGINIIGGNDKDRNTTALPDILSDALAVSFDMSIGHDYVDNATDRFAFYHTKEERIPFDLKFFNDITNGGLPNKTLNIIMSGTGVGKTLFMCHHAANILISGYDVLYITLEMAEERIAERIDANLMDLTIDELHDLPKTLFESSVDKIRKKTQGKLIIKEYPTASAHVGHFKSLIKELKIKRQFTPKIIFIDYLNICASSRFRTGANVGSYFYIKAIAEELRGFAVEQDVPIVSATQVNRTGFTASDFGLEDTSESFGLPATADFMFALIQTEELEELNQVLVKQLKNRYNDPTKNKKFILGIDRPKMKLYDVEQQAQADLVDSGQDIQTQQVNTEDWKF
jgi:archaellum biogenesis ATPase FlaH